MDRTDDVIVGIFLKIISKKFGKGAKGQVRRGWCGVFSPALVPHLHILLPVLFDDGFPACEVCQEFEMRLRFFGEGEEGHLHFVCEGTVQDADILVFDVIFKAADRGVGEGHGIAGIRRIGDDGRRLHGIGERAAVGPCEAARTELDAAEVAGDDREYIRELSHLEHMEHGVSRRALRLAVIARFLKDALCTDAPCVAVVRGVLVFLSEISECLLCFLFRVDRQDVRDKDRFLDFHVLPIELGRRSVRDKHDGSS